RETTRINVPAGVRRPRPARIFAQSDVFRIRLTLHLRGFFVRKIFAIGFLAWAGLASAQTVIQMPDSLWSAGDTITWVKKIPAFCEGPVWEPATGYVYFTRQQGSTTWPIIRIKPGVDT